MIVVNPTTVFASHGSFRGERVMILVLSVVSTDSLRRKYGE